MIRSHLFPKRDRRITEEERKLRKAAYYKRPDVMARHRAWKSLPHVRAKTNLRNKLKLEEYRKLHPLLCKKCGGTKDKKFGLYCIACAVIAKKEREARAALRMRQKGTWQAQHKAAKNRRKARLRFNGGTFTGTQFKELCDRFGNICLACGGIGVKLTVDHVKPLSKGGLNEIGNVQPLCRGCNVKKGVAEIDYRVVAG